MKRVATAIAVLAAGITFVWLYYAFMRGNVSDEMSYVIPALVYLLGGMLIGRMAGSIMYAGCLALLLAVPAAVLYGIAALMGDMPGYSTSMAWLLRLSIAVFIPVSTFVGVWFGRRLGGRS